MFIKTDRILPKEKLAEIAKCLGKEGIVVNTPFYMITNIDPAIMEVIENRKEDIYNVEISKDGDVQIYFERRN